MHEIPQNDRSPNGIAPMIAFALGALVGGGLALLWAPAPGATTRRRIGARANRLARDARHTFDDARTRVHDLGSDLRTAIDAGREAFQHDGKPHDPHPLPDDLAAPDVPSPRRP